MNFENKLKEFLIGNNLTSVPKEKNELDLLNCRNVNNLKLCWFELGVSIDSQVINFERNSFIGGHTYMNAGGYIRGPFFIGRYTSIGRRVSIAAGMHSMYGLSTSPAVRKGTASAYTDEQFQDLAVTKRSRLTIIMNDVWIGDGAIIMPGITVGTGAVIAANAVVVKNVEPYAVVGGVPAIVLKQRFPDNIIAILLKSNWWSLSPEQLSSHPVGNVYEFTDEVEKNFDRSKEYFWDTLIYKFN